MKGESSAISYGRRVAAVGVEAVSSCFLVIGVVIPRNSRDRDRRGGVLFQDTRDQKRSLHFAFAPVGMTTGVLEQPRSNTRSECIRPEQSVSLKRLTVTFKTSALYCYLY